MDYPKSRSGIYQADIYIQKTPSKDNRDEEANRVH